MCHGLEPLRFGTCLLFRNNQTYSDSSLPILEKKTISEMLTTMSMITQLERVRTRSLLTDIENNPVATSGRGGNRGVGGVGTNYWV